MTLRSLVITGLILMNHWGLAQNFKAFTQLLNENNLVFKSPEGFKEVKIKENGDLYYNYAMKLKKGDFEIRYTIFPLKPLLEEYLKSLTDTSVTMLAPNAYHPSMYIVNILNISQLGIENLPETVDFPAEAVLKEFGADYGATSFFTVNSEFGKGYDYGMMIVLHKTDVADVYISYLSSDRDNFFDFTQLAFHALRFVN